MKKRFYTVIAFLMTSIISFCFIDYRNTLNHEASVAYSAEESQIIEETPQSVSVSDMNSVQSEMGAGINLGNALDVCDWSYFGSNQKDGLDSQNDQAEAKENRECDSDHRAEYRQGSYG